MKVHYINILFFALPLYILENSKNKPSITQKITTTRLLFECELYSPVNYDNDPQMKKIMDNFNRQTSQRFHEYDERMQITRQKCKDQCDKEIQKIILKDKVEKELTEKFSTLHTDIQSDAIPTCTCQKSLADKTENFCLNCGKNMGAIAPWWGLICGSGYAGWTNYVTQTPILKGIEAGVQAGIEELKSFSGLDKLIPISKIENFINPSNYFKKMTYFTFAQDVNKTKCLGDAPKTKAFCNFVYNRGESALSERAEYIAELADQTAKNATATETANFIPKTTILTNTIIASMVAVVVIVLVMVIIYLILRYRRKKKMKKKLQYIKLLKE
ncbi:PIR protein [Plasmodium reichenowi]|uniref:PIR protein n=1 Tax=Plasmodium reichenowi TaxID=5854 RepID=A0A2P9D6K5_PLARE|nr:PIR protein [Plasmodium reichenowi]